METPFNAVIIYSLTTEFLSKDCGVKRGEFKV